MKVPKNITTKMYDITLERILTNLYMGFSQEEKDEMTKTFSSRDSKAKEKFLKKHLPNFNSIFEKEAKKLGEEIKEKMAALAV